MKITNLKVTQPVTKLGATIVCPECEWRNSFVIETDGKAEGDSEQVCHSCGAILTFHWNKEVG